MFAIPAWPTPQNSDKCSSLNELKLTGAILSKWTVLSSSNIPNCQADLNQLYLI